MLGGVLVWFQRAVLYTDQHLQYTISRLKAVIKVFWKFVIKQRFTAIDSDAYQCDVEDLAYKIDKLTV